jgi:hypothetical protein
MADGAQLRRVQLGAAAAQGAGGSLGHHGRWEAELGAAPATVTTEGGVGCKEAARGGAGVGGGARCWAAAWGGTGSGVAPGTARGGARVRGGDGDY